jgi:hypothetical protein
LLFGSYVARQNAFNETYRCNSYVFTDRLLARPCRVDASELVLGAVRAIETHHWSSNGFVDKMWVFEIKWDGFRLVTEKRGVVVAERYVR